MGNLTFTMIKPDAVRAHKEAEILKHLTDAGFRIVALRMRRMSHAEAEKFYAVHRDKPFFGTLVEFMTSGPVVAERPTLPKPRRERCAGCSARTRR